MASGTEENGLAFIVIEPGGIIPDYAVEISDADVEIFGITGSEDTMILNIVTLAVRTVLQDFSEFSRTRNRQSQFLGSQAVYY